MDVTVSLGNATTAMSAQTPSLWKAITVTAASASAVDVTSTEIATNITREELHRLPVDQTVASVAVLAPGVNKGTAGFGGITFGGSSIAENSYYVNGLNVTDFYNRNGFSEAPFAFYQEFQVKTGGYSVEFGRSTGGVVNAVTRSGSNDFHYGAELTTDSRTAWESGRPQRLQRRRHAQHRQQPGSRSADETQRVRVRCDRQGHAVFLPDVRRPRQQARTIPTTTASASPTTSPTTASGAARSTGTSTTRICSS